jgi:hypothetical protein
MVKGIQVDEILKALPREGRAEFAEKLKREGGVEVVHTYTVGGKHRKRKNRWASAQGKVIPVRVPNTVYGRIKDLAEKGDTTISEWCRANLIRAAGLLPDGKVRKHH